MEEAKEQEEEKEEEKKEEEEVRLGGSSPGRTASGEQEKIENYYITLIHEYQITTKASVPKASIRT